MAWCHGQQAKSGGKALGGRIDPDGSSMVITTHLLRKQWGMK
jgi:hypothetical protein